MCPPSNTCFLGPTWVHTPNGILICSAIFAHFGRVSLYFTWAAPFPLQIARSHGGSGPPCNTWLLELTRVQSPNGISIGSAVLAGPWSWQTDHTTLSVTIGRIYIRSTAMHSNNKNPFRFGSINPSLRQPRLNSSRRQWQQQIRRHIRQYQCQNVDQLPRVTLSLV